MIIYIFKYTEICFCFNSTEHCVSALWTLEKQENVEWLMEIFISKYTYIVHILHGSLLIIQIIILFLIYMNINLFLFLNCFMFLLFTIVHNFCTNVFFCSWLNKPDLPMLIIISCFTKYMFLVFLIFVLNS